MTRRVYRSYSLLFCSRFVLFYFVCVFFLSVLTCLDTTGRGSVFCLGLMRMEIVEDVVIFLNRLFIFCVDFFSKEVIFCVDFFKRFETVGANLFCLFKFLLSMLIVKSMEFRFVRKRE